MDRLEEEREEIRGEKRRERKGVERRRGRTLSGEERNTKRDSIGGTLGGL